MHKDPVLQGCYISFLFPMSLTSYLNRSLPLILDSHHVRRSSVWSQFLSAGKIISLGQQIFASTHDDFREVGMNLSSSSSNHIISYHIIISPCVINYHFSIIMIRIISNEHGTGCFKQYVQLQGPRVQKPMIFPCFRGFPIATCLIPIAWAAMFHQSDVTSPGVVRMEGPPEELICATTHLTLFSAILRQLECLNVQAGETKTR